MPEDLTDKLAITMSWSESDLFLWALHHPAGRGETYVKAPLRELAARIGKARLKLADDEAAKTLAKVEEQAGERLAWRDTHSIPTRAMENSVKSAHQTPVPDEGATRSLRNPEGTENG